jgi:hypothetical protein
MLPPIGSIWNVKGVPSEPAYTVIGSGTDDKGRDFITFDTTSSDWRCLVSNLHRLMIPAIDQSISDAHEFLDNANRDA